MKPTYTLTTIAVQGDEQQVFEVYTDETKEQTRAFCFDEADANLIAAAPELLGSVKEFVKSYEYYLNHDRADLPDHYPLLRAITKAEGEEV